MHKNGCLSISYNEFVDLLNSQQMILAQVFKTIAAQILKKYKITSISKFCTTRCANKRWVLSRPLDNMYISETFKSINREFTGS